MDNRITSTRITLTVLLLAAVLATGCAPEPQPTPTVVAATPTRRVAQVTATFAPTPTPVAPPGFGVVNGRVDVPSELASATDEGLDLIFENAMTQEATFVPLGPGEDVFDVTLPVGTYYARAWLPGFGHTGAHAGCPEGETCEQNALLPITVPDGKAVSGVDMNDWYAVQEPPLALVGGVLIDGNGGDPLADAALVIWDGRIVAVGPRAEVDIPANARIINLDGATILPGFINAHVHGAYNGRNLALWAFDGVTTVRDLAVDVAFPYIASRDELSTDHRRARLLISGPIITVPGGVPMNVGGVNSLTVTSPDDARRKVDQLIDAGVDVIKTIAETSMGPNPSAEEIAAMVEAAHARGVPVTVHVTRSARGLRDALEAGVDELAHMPVRLDDEDIQQIIDADIYIVTTLLQQMGGGASSLGDFVEAGGKVALGSAAGNTSGVLIGMPMNEMAAMQDAGMTPMQIIVAATRNGAHVCNRGGALGTLETGKLADVLVVDGDPLADLQALGNTRLVVLDGVVIREEGLGE